MNILVLFAGHWDLMFAYKVAPVFHNFSRMSYIIDKASSMPADAAEFKENVVLKDGT